MEGAGRRDGEEGGGGPGEVGRHGWRVEAGGGEKEGRRGARGWVQLVR